MSAKRKEAKAVVKEVRRGKETKVNVPNAAAAAHIAQKQAIIVAEHLPPLVLVLTILLCSGFMFVLGMRDLMATGKNILGESDAAYLVRWNDSLRWLSVALYIALHLFELHCIECFGYFVYFLLDDSLTAFHPGIHQINGMVRRSKRMEIDSGRV